MSESKQSSEPTGGAPLHTQFSKPAAPGSLPLTPSPTPSKRRTSTLAILRADVNPYTSCTLGSQSSLIWV